MAEACGSVAGLGEEAGERQAERAEGPGKGPSSSGGHGGGTGGAPAPAAGAASEHFCPNYRAIRNALRSSSDGAVEVAIPADDLMKIMMFMSLHPEVTSAVKDSVGELTAALDGPESPEGTVLAPKKAVRKVMKCVAERLQADLGRVAPPRPGGGAAAEPPRRPAAEPRAAVEADLGRVAPPRPGGGAAAEPPRRPAAEPRAAVEAPAAAAAAAAAAGAAAGAPAAGTIPSSPEQPPAAAEPPQPAEAADPAARLAALRQKLLQAKQRGMVVKVEDDAPEADLPARPPSSSKRRRRRSERTSSSPRRSRSYNRSRRRRREHRGTRSIRRETRSQQRPRASPSSGRAELRQTKLEAPAELPPGHWHPGRQGPAGFPAGLPRVPRLHPGVGPCDRLRGHIASLCPDGSGYIASDSVQGDIWFQALPALRLRLGDTVDFDFAHSPQGLPLAANLQVLPHLAPAPQQQGHVAFHRPYSSTEGQLRLATEFMRRHACRTHEEPYTHSSMLGKSDPWAPGVGRFGFGAEPHAQEELARALEVFYLTEGGGKLYLTEHPTELYAFVEDIDVEGSRSSGPPDLMRPSDGDLELLKWRATVLREMFPSAQFRCMLYQSTGWYSGSELYKESYHLVWRDIIVDKETAVQIRQRTVEVFESLSQTPGHPLFYLLTRAKQFCDYNRWDRIFDASTTRRSVGLRMPYCDKRSILPGAVRKSWRDEFRPVLPVGELEFRIERRDEALGGEICTSVLLAERPEQRPPWQWALLGMCRRPEGVRRSHFRPPQLERPPPPRAPPQRAGARRPGSGTSAPAGTKGKCKGKPKGGGKGPAAGKGKGAAAAAAASSSAAAAPTSSSAAASSSSAGREVQPTPMLPPFSQTRLFKHGSRAAFREALLQRSRTPLEEKAISGGVQFILPGKGNVNYFEKSLKVVIQGRDAQALKALVEGWTEPL